MGHGWLRRCMWLLIGASALGSGIANPANAQGRMGSGPVTLAIGSAAGGGYDQYARLTARYLQRELPGNPTVIAKNVTGAGGIVILNWAYNSAPRDGTVIATTQGSSVFAGLQGMPGAQYDPRNFNWLISLGNLTNMLLVWHTSSVNTIDDVMNKGMALGNVAGLSVGGATVLGVMAASASYIAAPAAVRIALPDANPSLYLTASLGITFPFNLAIGIPLYHELAKYLG